MAAILSVLILVLYPGVVFGLQAFVLDDFAYYGYPLAAYYRDCFWRQELPLWNPLSYCGVPFLAQWNTLVLYPLSLLYLLLPLPWALNVFCLLHLWLAGMGMYWLAWRWTGSRFAGGVAGLAYAFNGLTLHSLIWPQVMVVVAWMPLVLLSVERAWQRGGRWVVLAALAGAMQMLGGFPEGILLTWLLAPTIWATHRFANRLERARSLGRWGLVVLLIAGLAAAQLLPFLDLAACSQRGRQPPSLDCTMPGTGWANLWVPLFYTAPRHHGVWYQFRQYFTTSYYFGLGVMALATLAVWRFRSRRTLALAMLAGLGLVLAVGEHGFLFRTLRQAAPFLSVFRFPIKFVYLTLFTLPLLAAFAAARLAESTGPEATAERGRLIKVALLFMGVIGGILYFAYSYPLLLPPQRLWRATWQNALVRVAWLCLFVTGLCWIGRETRPRLNRLAQASVLFVLWLDVWTHTPIQQLQVAPSAYEPDLKVMSPQPASGRDRAAHSLLATATVFFNPVSDVFTNVLVQRLALGWNFNLLEHIPQISGFYPLIPRETEELERHLYLPDGRLRPNMADFLAVSQTTLPGRPLDWQRRTNCLPLATSGQKPIYAAGTNALALLEKPAFDPRREVVLPVEAKTLISVTNQTQAIVLAQRFTGHRVELEVQAARPSLVVISQSFYHCWKAYLDGRPTTLWRANYAFQALQTPAGRHHVVLRYEDRPFQAGGVLSGLALLACLALWIRGRPANALTDRGRPQRCPKAEGAWHFSRALPVSGAGVRRGGSVANRFQEARLMACWHGFV